ncbi:integrase/recombinase xerD homolog [Saccoglossus kowalevskii]|uniref:Uncharacterized protein LOC102801160 n=1 Tax=Saccoglossus kowalevskii TaxID=10224 RepID=A0ABM0N0Z0_SACKO|nr:PREDICTED: uncharacterized protein LOC102801160 [Saccoglossus kowalevskii]
MNNVPVSSPFLPSISENLLLLFITYCYEHLHLSAATIELYLSGIRFKYIEAGFPNPLRSFHGGPLDRLKLLIKSIKRVQGKPRRARLPLTANIVAQLIKALKKRVFTPYTDVLLEAVILVAFFGFLRCGEFAIDTTQFDHQVHLCVEDVKFKDTSRVYLTLKKTKTDPFRRRTTLTLCSNDSLCPVKALQVYINLRRHRNPLVKPCDPLFIFRDGLLLSCSRFLHYLRSLLNIIGVDARKYSGHSFRIGAATTAAHVGVQDHLIKSLGRWSSDSYNRYIHVSDKSLFAAQSALVNKV